MSKRVPIGFVGLTHHGRTMLDAARKCPNIEIISCFDVDNESTIKAASELRCTSVSSLEEMTRDTAIHAVVLVTPNHLHEGQALTVLKAGKHVFVEKPISHSAESARGIVTLAEVVNKIVQVGHNTRKRKIFRTAKALLEENEIGSIVGVEANFSYPGAFQENIPEWKLNEEFCPLLPMTQLGVHLIDTLQYLIGDIIDVSCNASSVLMRDTHGNPIIDSTAATIRFETGCMGSIQSHYVIPDTFYIRLYGTEGVIECFEDKLIITTGMEDGKVQRDLPMKESMNQSFIDELTEFADCISNQTQPEVDGTIGVTNMLVLDAMVKSYRTGRKIRISDI